MIETELNISSGPQDDFERANSTFQSLNAELVKSIYMAENDRVVLLGALCTSEHVLLDGTYGTGKSTIAKALGEATSGTWGRIQGTPDVEASNINGINIWNPDTRSFDFVEGPIFNNVVLADEIHRIPGKSQAGLMEAMAERQVTIDGKTYELPDPFMLIGTKNDDGPEVTNGNLDRFAFGIHMPEQDTEELLAIDSLLEAGYKTKAVADAEAIQHVSSVIKEDIKIDPSIKRFAAEVLKAVHSNENIDQTESINGGYRHFDAVKTLAKFAALTERERTVAKKHVAFAMPYVLQHRVKVLQKNARNGVTPRQVVDSTIARLAA